MHTEPWFQEAAEELENQLIILQKGERKMFSVKRDPLVVDRQIAATTCDWKVRTFCCRNSPKTSIIK